MTRQQIAILINDGDISLMNGTYKSGMSDFSFVNNTDKEIYLISDRLYDFIQFILDFLIDGEKDDGKQILLEEIRAIGKIYMPGSKIFKNKIEEMIVAQSKIYEASFYIDGFGYRLNDNENNLFLIIEDLLSDENGGSEIIEFIKFEILHGKKISEISKDQIYNEFKIQFLQKYFYEPMRKLSDKAIAASNIKYLQNLIGEINVPKLEAESKLSLQHNAVVMLLLFTGKKLTQLAAENIIKKHNLTNKVTDITDKFKEIDSRESILNIYGTTGKPNGVIRTTRVKQLNSILNLLPLEQQKVVNIYIDKLNELTIKQS